MGYLVKLSTTTHPIEFGPIVLTSDHLSPATGKTLTVTISKDGGSFASPAGAVTEVGNGFYKLAGNATDNNTLGPLKVHVAVGGDFDVFDEDFGVVAGDPWASIPASVAGAVGSVTGAVGSVTGNVGGNVVGSVASVTAGVTLAAGAVQAIWDALTSALTTSGSIGKKLLDWMTGATAQAAAAAALAADTTIAGINTKIGTPATTLATVLDIIAKESVVGTIVTPTSTTSMTVSGLPSGYTPLNAFAWFTGPTVWGPYQVTSYTAGSPATIGFGASGATAPPIVPLTSETVQFLGRVS